MTEDEALHRCGSCGRDHATRDRAVACSCSGGLVAMQRAAQAVLDAQQAVLDEMALREIERELAGVS